MPSQRRRIGFLPSEEVHHIIDKLSRANEFSQSKVTGLLVEEALMYRGVLRKSVQSSEKKEKNLINDLFEEELLSKNNNSLTDNDVYTINKNLFSDNVKMMHDYIQFKYFKKIMKQNKKFLE